MSATTVAYSDPAALAALILAAGGMRAQRIEQRQGVALAVLDEGDSEAGPTLIRVRATDHGATVAVPGSWLYDGVRARFSRSELDAMAAGSGLPEATEGRLDRLSRAVC